MGASNKTAAVVDASDQTWGAPLKGGRNRPLVRRIALGVSLMAGILALASAATAGAVLWTVNDRVERVALTSLESNTRSGPLNVLVVGSDSREGLTRDELIDLTLGADAEIDGRRSDTILLVSILPEDRGISIVSLPRDLEVVFEGNRRKLTETFMGGPDGVVTAVRENYGIPIHHYVEVDVQGFLGTVEALGSVEICLDEPLVDAKSGANFAAGCQRMDPVESLAYVRSRQGSRGDFERIERQQIFIRAVIKELDVTGLLLDPPRLIDVVEQVASNVKTDETLDLGRMSSLANKLRAFAAGGVPMTFVPGYTADRGAQNFVVPYAPGAIALFDSIEAGRPLIDRGSRETRADTAVVVWHAGQVLAADRVQSVLGWSGFRVGAGGRGSIDAGAMTTVYALEGKAEAAARVAATLGAPTLPFPADRDQPGASDVVVVVSEDALT